VEVLYFPVFPVFPVVMIREEGEQTTGTQRGERQCITGPESRMFRPGFILETSDEPLWMVRIADDERQSAQ
jgi:hypothetical protein